MFAPLPLGESPRGSVDDGVRMKLCDRIGWRAAQEVAAAVEEGMSQRTVATVLKRDESFIRHLLRWRKGGFTSASALENRETRHP